MDRKNTQNSELGLGEPLIRGGCHLAADDVCGQHAEFPVHVCPHRKSLCLGLPLADDAHDGDLGLLGVANGLAHGHAADRLDADAILSHLLGDFLDIRHYCVCDGQERDLHRGEPNGEGPCIVLDQDAHESLQRAQNGPVDHDWPLLVVFGRDVVHVESFRQVEIELDRRALPLPAEGVPDLDVNLGPVEGAAAVVHRISPALLVERLH
mmetsp:Transcript_4626/g.13149  ORF Transcript_4626/g.13149 Transcript_4626/m.13149 type:complete len:209 (-) Transcript_4626:1511-2137(-)